MTSAEKVRVFIALDIPSRDKETLKDTISNLQRAIPKGVKWVDPNGIHLTLKFLGDVPVSVVEKLLTAMQKASDEFQQRLFALKLSGLGVFPNARQPRVLWVGADGDLESLETLQKLVDRAISALGYALENRPFRPHLTIGRIRDSVSRQMRQDIGTKVMEIKLPASECWQVDRMHLIESNRTPQGAIYTSLGSVEL